jgi:serine phosphatase RsbU (regulator of sigma subunit)
MTNGSYSSVPPGGQPREGVSARSLLRREELSPWLTDLAEAVGLPYALCTPGGEWIAGSGATEGLTARHEVHVQGVPVATLLVPPNAPAPALGAMLGALRAHAASRSAIQDFSRSLAAAWKESNFLHEVQLLLTAVVEVEEAARVVVGQLARVQRAGRVALALVRDGRWRLVAAWPEASSEVADWAALLTPTGVTEPQVHLGPDTCVVGVPLTDGEQTLGCLMLQGPPSIAHAGNVRFLSGVGTQIAQAMRLRLLIQQQIEAAEMRRELLLGAEIQRSMLPQSAPLVPGLAIAGVCRPAHGVGGDGFDYHLHPGALDVVIADVTGHGVAAGLLMSSFIGMLRAMDLVASGPAEIAAEANRRVSRHVGLSGHFVAASYARFDRPSRRLTYALLGHLPPLLRRDGQVQALPAAGGMPAGLLDDAAYSEASVTLLPGDTVLFYTDGLIEAPDPAGRLFGLDGLTAAFAAADSASPDALLQALIAACRTHEAGRPPRDDQTAVVLMVAPDHDPNEDRAHG